jgi:CDP-4-dehydro-6-deoxyglucose reductase
MAIHFEGSTFELLPGETVLEGIERQGASLPAFCRRGVCQICVVRAKRGAVPAAAQNGLKDSLRLQSVFLACQCRPTEDLELERMGSAAKYASRVERVEPLSPGVLRVLLAAPTGFSFRAGQFLQLERASDGLTRAYSIASLPGEALELHVALLPGGALSGWLAGATGERVSLSGPFGECFYLPEEPERPLCLAGSGTGLAPLIGVVRAALAADHRGPIRLYHGSPRAEGLYFWAELQALVRQNPQLRVIGSLLDGSAGAGPASGDTERCQIRVAALDELLLDGALWSEERVYLCGNDELVRKLQKKVYLAGVPLARIHADRFVAPGASVARVAGSAGPCN